MTQRQHLFDTEESVLPQIRVWLRSTIGQAASKVEGYQFIQAVDELCSNIVEHADDQPDKRIGSLSIQVSTYQDRLEAHVTYAGDDFDLTTFMPRPIEDIVMKGHKGGLGIRLIQALASRVDYRREGRLNICTIEKRLNA